MVSNTQEFQIAIVPGDGIGHEIMDACIAVLRALERKHGLIFHCSEVEAGAEYYARSGTDITDEDFTALGAAAAEERLLLGCPHGSTHRFAAWRP